jgi:hypothetical protein
MLFLEKRRKRKKRRNKREKIHLNGVLALLFKNVRESLTKKRGQTVTKKKGHRQVDLKKDE